MSDNEKGEKMKKLTGKRGKIFRELIKAGKSEAYAKRISKGLAEGKTRQESRGRHPGERYKKRGTTYKPAPKGRLEKKKEAWALYSYFDGIYNQASDSDSEILGMTSYDLTKTLYKNYNAEALFAMHQYMERELQHYLNLEMELADISEINIEDNTEYNTKHRRFLWQLTDMITGEIRYHLIYEKGQILEKKMWEGFDSLDFKINIRELRIWE